MYEPLGKEFIFQNVMPLFHLLATAWKQFKQKTETIGTMTDEPVRNTAQQMDFI